MNAESIITVSAAVVALVQLVKWAGLRDAWGPFAVLVLSGLGVGVFIFGGDHWPPVRMDTWPTFAGWIAVATSAAGVFGFTRAAVGAVTRATPPPPDGAGSEATADAPRMMLTDDDVDRIARRGFALMRQEHEQAPPSTTDAAERG